MSKGLGITLAVVGVLLLVFLMVFGSFKSAQNQMVAKDQNVKTAWSEVEVQMQRRADLIPNLVSTVKGFTKEESGVYGEVAQAREGYMNAQTPEAKIAANGQIDGALAKLLVITENYPELRSSDQFARLQDELAGTENRIAVARKRYNESFRITTPTSCNSRIAFGPASWGSTRTTRASRPALGRRTCRRLVSEAFLSRRAQMPRHNLAFAPAPVCVNQHRATIRYMGPLNAAKMLP